MSIYILLTAHGDLYDCAAIPARRCAGDSKHGNICGDGESRTSVVTTAPRARSILAASINRFGGEIGSPAEPNSSTRTEFQSRRATARELRSESGTLRCAPCCAEYCTQGRDHGAATTVTAISNDSTSSCMYRMRYHVST